MISSISPLLNRYKCYNTVSFGTMEREVYNDSKNKINYRNNTNLFRADINWRSMANYIAEGDKPKKIYCYACSDGSEPYTIAISLISKLGWDEAQKYFPIIAKDIDPYPIQKAKSGFINLTHSDIIEMMNNQKRPLTDFFIYKKNTAFVRNYDTYKVTDSLRNCVNFEVGNLLNDAKSLDYDNSIIFFRNVWPYLSQKERNNLMKTFSENFKENTSMVAGAFDENPDKDDILIWTDFEYEMQTHGLYRTRNRIYCKLDINMFKKFIKTLWTKFIYYF